MPTIEAEKPRTLVHLLYLSEDDTEMTGVHVFADPESLDLHLEGVAERSALWPSC